MSQSLSLWDNDFIRKKSWNADVAALWSETPFFMDIPLKDIKKLVKHMHHRKYKAGEAIFNAGDLGAGAALILQGQVAIQLNGTTLATLAKGDFFGEIALILNERRSADAIAMENTELVFFLRPDFDEWVQRAPQLGARLSQNLAHLLAKRLMNTNVSLANKKKVRKRA